MIKKASKKSWTMSAVCQDAGALRPTTSRPHRLRIGQPTWADASPGGGTASSSSSLVQTCTRPLARVGARTDRRRARRRSVWREGAAITAPPPFAEDLDRNAACWGCFAIWTASCTNHHERSTSRVLPSAVLRACPCLSVPSTHSLACVARALARTNENLMNIFDFAVGTVRSFCITRTQHGIGIPIRHASTLVTTERF